MNFPQSRDKARDMIRKFGNSSIATFAQGAGTYDPETSSVVFDPDDSPTVYAVLLPLDVTLLTPESNLVQATDNILICAALDTSNQPFEPTLNGNLVFGGKAYTAVEITTLRPDGVVPIYHQCGVRGL